MNGNQKIKEGTKYKQKTNLQCLGF